eukprot:4529614-Pyramimonas_sp.AAC.1
MGSTTRGGARGGTQDEGMGRDKPRMWQMKRQTKLYPLPPPMRCRSPVQASRSPLLKQQLIYCVAGEASGTRRMARTETAV